MLIAVYNIPAIRKMIRLFDFRAKRIVWQIGIFADYSSSHGLSEDVKWDPNGIICCFAQDKLREGARKKTWKNCHLLPNWWGVSSGFWQKATICPSFFWTPSQDWKWIFWEYSSIVFNEVLDVGYQLVTTKKKNIVDTYCVIMLNELSFDPFKF